MKEIFLDAVGLLPELASDYSNTMQGIAKMAETMRKDFLANGTIIDVPTLTHKETAQTSMCAIDGASGQEKMQSADVLIAGATLHEGAHSKPIFGQSEEATDSSGETVSKPYSGFYDIVLHTSKNDSSLSAMRAYTEIVILGEAEHDIAIIDGAYLGNLLTVLYQLSGSATGAKVIIDKMHKDGPERFIKGVRKLLDISKQNQSGKHVVALAKSDSSSEMVRRYAGKSDFFATDKMLAEYLLKPGEMLVPTRVRSNIDKVSMLEKSDSGSWGHFKWNAKKSLESADYQILLDLFDGKRGEEDLFSLYTYLYNFEAYQYFYFKPNKFMEGSNPLRVEFVADVSDAKNADKAATERGQMIASNISADIIQANIKEPFCQYMVDRDVKGPVSSALKFYRGQMSKLIKGTGVHVEGLVAGYRT